MTPGNGVATNTAKNLLRRAYEPLNLIPAGHGIVERFGLQMRMQGIIPEEEENDAFIIVEAALIGAAMLLTSDGHMLSAQESGKLQSFLSDCSVSGDRLLIARPRDIVRKFMRR